MKYLHLKIVILILVFILIFTPKSHAKYVIDSNTLAAILNIDRTKPTIEVVSAKKTNYDKTTNTSDVIITIKAIDKNLKNNIDTNKIKVIVEDKIIKCKKEILNLKYIDNGIEFDLIISNIKNDKKLKVLLHDGLMEDESSNTTQELEYEIKIVYQ